MTGTVDGNTRKADRHTQRTMDWLRKKGLSVDKAEYWKTSHHYRNVVTEAKNFRGYPHGLQKALSALKNGSEGVRKDLFGFIDIVTAGDGAITAWQVCARSGISAHKKKILTECTIAALNWLLDGGRIKIIGWKRFDETIPGDRRKIRENIREITLEDFV